MRNAFLKILVFSLASLISGCASQPYQGGTGTTPFTNPQMDRKTEDGPLRRIGPSPVESSPSLRGLPETVPGPNAPDKGEKGPY